MINQLLISIAIPIGIFFSLCFGLTAFSLGGFVLVCLGLLRLSSELDNINGTNRWRSIGMTMLAIIVSLLACMHYIKGSFDCDGYRNLICRMWVISKYWFDGEHALIVTVAAMLTLSAALHFYALRCVKSKTPDL